MPTRPVVLAVILLATSVLAGCTEPASVPTATPPPARPAWHVASAADLGLPCDSLCEPSVAVDADGWVFVSGGGARLRSPDGVAFEPMVDPPMPAVGAGPSAFRTDTLIQVGPDGSLYYSALVATFEFVSRTLILHGVQVARSDDHGASWASSVLVSPVDGQDVGSGADRQWLAFDGLDGSVYVVFQRIPAAFNLVVPPLATPLPGIWAARSDDRGASFGPLVEVTPGALPTSSYIVGPPVVHDGVLQVPYHWFPGDDRESVAAIAFSTDRGASFETRPVGPVGAFFPHLAYDGPVGAYVTWTFDRDLAIARTADGGATWDPLDVAVSSGRMASSPWARFVDGALAVAWTENDPAVDDDDRFILHWTTFGPDGVTSDLIVTGFRGDVGLRTNTDFVHFDMRGETPLLVQGDNEASSVTLYALARGEGPP